MVLRVVFSIVLALGVSAAHAQTLPAKDAARLTTAAKTALAKRLKDPESLRLRELFISSSEFEVEGKTVIVHYVCGEMNAKNSMGGYGGFRRFAANSVGVHVDDPDDQAGASAFESAVWSRLCTNKVQVAR